MKVISKVISKLITQVRFKFLVTTIIVSLIIAVILFYILEEQERSLRIFTQERLTETIEEKYKVEKELNEEKEKAGKLEVELKQKNQQINLVLNKLEEEISVRRQAQARLLITLKEKRNLEESLQDVAQKPEGIELEKIIVTANPLLSGEVLDVNEEYRFILVNLGRADGLDLGNVLSVYRGPEFIGEVEVERVEEKTAACAILSAWKEREFKEKDMVKRP